MTRIDFPINYRNYTAMVYDDGTKIYAVDSNGRPLYIGTVGTNDAVALQTALTVGGKILLHSDITVSDTLTMVSDSELIGIGNPTLTAANGLDKDILTVNDASHVRIEGIQIDGNKANNTVGSAVVAYGDDISISRLKIWNPAYIGLYIYDAKNVYADTLDIRGCGWQGIAIEGYSEGGPCHNIHVQHFYIYNSGVTEYSTAINAIHIEGPAVGSNFPRGCSVTHGRIDTAYGTGIMIGRSHYNNISDVEILNCGTDGIAMLTASTFNTIINCKSHDNGTREIGGWGAGIHMDTSDYNHITQCVIEDNYDNGISMSDGSDNNQIDHNRIDTQTTGIAESGASDNNDIHHNELYNCTTAVAVVGTGTTTYGNKGYDPMPNISFGAAAPAAGYWKQGSIRINSGAAAGGSPGWVCTTAGTPGTWKAMANLVA